MPSDYPFRPPAFMLLTPNGRFETGVKICLSISAHHPEHWQPSWSVRTALTALVAFMPSPGNGAIGSLVRSLLFGCNSRQVLRVSKYTPPPTHPICTTPWYVPGMTARHTYTSFDECRPQAINLMYHHWVMIVEGFETVCKPIDSLSHARRWWELSDLSTLMMKNRHSTPYDTAWNRIRCSKPTTLETLRG